MRILYILFTDWITCREGDGGRWRGGGWGWIHRGAAGWSEAETPSSPVFLLIGYHWKYTKRYFDYQKQAAILQCVIFFVKIQRKITKNIPGNFFHCSLLFLFQSLITDLDVTSEKSIFVECDTLSDG